MDNDKSEHVEKPSPNQTEDSLDMGYYLKEGFNIVKDNPVPFILGNLVLLIINGIAMGLLVGPWYAGMYHMVRKARKGEAIEFGDAFWGFNNFIPVFVAGLIFSFCVGIGACLCLVPGLIGGGILLYLIPLVAFKGEELSSAVTNSKNEAMKSLVSHTLFFLLASIVSCVGFILCGVGAIFTFPVGIAAMAVCYEDRLG
jgi:hypothetical protein